MPIGIGSNAEHRETTSDQDPRTGTEFLDCLVQDSINRAALPEYGDHTTSNEYQEYDVLRRRKTFWHCKQEMPGLQADLSVGIRVFEGVCDDHLPGFVPRIGLPLELALWHRIGHQLSDDDNRENDGQGIDGPAAFCHGAVLLFLFGDSI